MNTYRFAIDTDFELAQEPINILNIFDFIVETLFEFTSNQIFENRIWFGRMTKDFNLSIQNEGVSFDLYVNDGVTPQK